MIRKIGKTEQSGFLRKMIAIAGPVMLQQVVNLGVSLTDNIMVGKLKEDAISGVAVGNQFYLLFHIFCLGLGGGSAVVIGQLWGKKDIPGIKSVITLMLRVCTVAAAFFMALSFFFPMQIMGIFAKEQGTIAQGAIYVKMMTAVYLIHGISLTLTIAYRAVGVLKLALLSSACSFGINIFFNWVFIFGKLGMPRMGVAGAALGTILARLVDFLIIGYYLLFRDRKIQYRLSDGRRTHGTMGKVFFRVAVPVIVSDVILQLGNNAVTVIMGHMKNSREMLSANSITATTVQLSTFFLLGLSNAASVMVGNSIGAGKPEEAESYGKRFLWISIAVGAAGAVILRLLGPFVTGLYDITEETRACTLALMDAISLILVFQSVASVLTKGVLRGGGDTRFLMLADVLFLWIASVPLGYLAGIVWELSAFWVYIAIKIDLVIKAVWCTGRLYRGNWKRSVS